MRDPDLLRVSKTLRKWAIGQMTDDEENSLTFFLMELFKDNFTPVDCPQITLEDLDFNYYGDGSFAPDSIQGVIAETAGETQIKWTFKIAPDGSNQILTIDACHIYMQTVKKVLNGSLSQTAWQQICRARLQKIDRQHLLLC
jgi:hypothetical protein